MSSKAHIALSFLLIVFSAAVCLRCGEEDDLGKITQNMRDRLGNALGFDGGETLDGPPPPEHAESSEHPQIIDFDVPDSLEPGDRFEIVLTTDFSDIDKVKGAVVHVEDAQNHILISKELLAASSSKLTATGNLPGIGGASGKARMTLTGTVSEDFADLWGHKYKIFIAMTTVDDEAGNYVAWKLELPRLEKSASEGEGEGEIDGDWSGTPFLKCSSDKFRCSDDDAGKIWMAHSDASECTSNCDSDFDTEEGAQAYSNCVSCCFSNEMVAAVDADAFKECWACFYYVYDLESGKKGSTEDAYGEAADLWEGYEFSAASCVE